MQLKNILNYNSPLALVMCVKNEEKGLLKALESVSGLVSEIVIAVDKDSSDNTEKIARKYATTFKTFTFENDFSKIRNFALEGVKSKWCLILDGHEFVKNRGKIFEALQSSADGLLCTIEMENCSKFRNPRIIRSHVKYKGRVHEQQICNKIQPFFDFVIKHDRPNNQSVFGADIRDRQRKSHTLESLKADLKDDNKNINALFHLILYYQANLKTFQSRLLIRRFLKISKDKQFIWFLFYNQSLVYLTKKKYCLAYIYACDAERAMPGRWETKKIKALIFLENKNWKKAINFLIGSIDNNKEYCHFEPLMQNIGSTWNLVGEAYFNQKDYFKAQVAFKRASKMAVEPALKELAGKRAQFMKNFINNF